MRFQAARMHKKAVRRAKQERHQAAQRRYRGKCANASPHSGARRAALHTPRKPKPTHLTEALKACSQLPQLQGARGVMPRIANKHRRDRSRETHHVLRAIWFMLVALTLPTALNFHETHWRRETTKREGTRETLPPFAHEVETNLLPEATGENVSAQYYPPEMRALRFSQQDRSALQLEFMPARTAPLPVEDLLEPPRRLHRDRLIAVHALTLGVGIYGLRYMNGIFGGVSQPFQVGNDWNKDHFLHFDELLHLQGAYRITQAVSEVYQWAGVKPKHADWIGAGTAATLMTTMEYIDGRRKHDEASYSDFAANLLGAGLALAKPRCRFLQDFDLRLSYRTLSDPFDRHRMKRYDRMTHWLTYDLHRKWELPLHVGVGYSVQRAGTPRAKAEYFFGVGISPQTLLKQIFPSAPQTLGWLDLYHFGNQVQINTANSSVRKNKRSGR